MKRGERLANGYVLREDDPGNDGKGKGEDPPKKEEETPPTPVPNTIPLEVLPEELRGKSQAEIKFMLERMADSTVSSSQQIRELREQLEAVRSRVEEKPPEPDPFAEVSDEELIVQNPSAAIKRVLEREGLLARFDGLAGTVQETIWDTVRTQIPDFGEHEDNIKAMLKQTGTPVTRQNVVSAYTMSVGMKALQERNRKTRENINRVDPEPPKDDDKLPELSGLEADIFESSGMTRAQWEAYKDDSSLDTIKVPR